MAGPARGRRIWLKIHKWIGLSFGFLFVFEAVTGCILVFQHEISDAFDAPYAAVGAPVGVGVDRAVALARAANGGGDLALVGLPASNADHAYRVLIASQDHTTRELFVDPSSGRVDRDHQRPVGAVLKFIWTLHKRLAVPLAGDLLIAVSGLVLVLSTVSGLVLWWPKPGKWRKALAIKKNATLPRLTFDLHRVLGAVLAVMCLLWGISGTYMIRPSWIVGLLPIDTRPRNEQTVRTAPPAKAEPINTHQPLSPTAIARLASQVPGTTGTYLFSPEDPTDCAWQVRLSRPDDRVRYVGSATVTVNACTGTITGINDERGDVSSRIFYWLRPLHSGEAFGIVGKIVVLILGLAFLAIGIAGIYLWWIRRGARKLSARSRSRARRL
ncbi:PepSY-associated TM helix domain-containing protein [Sphingomonas sp. Leaf242]|uniref:PepSY-associated TM helix domain-containing protein n=1 Tax=Sphingomonas sp. Leaf242 TaxID=1736304 RepID=UPI0007135C53|nr:PepSY-associated TM helix domain-containing protein [Sphingomonas sp. Leaf242]KQO05135.1 hypothetical protein ASF09_17180 [Sphingomonas sp. Leaf242]